MSHKKMIILLSALIVFPLSIMGVSANTKGIIPGSPSLKVNPVYNTSRNVYGTSNRGTKVYVRLNNKHLLGSTYSSKRNGSFIIKISRKLNRNDKLYVYAQKGQLKPYNIINVQTKNNPKKNNSKNKNVHVKSKKAKRTTKRTNTKKNKHVKNIKKIKANNIEGRWITNLSHGYKQVWTINNNSGFNVNLYKNNHFQRHLIQNAIYYIKPTKKINLYRFIYRGKGQRRNSYVYFHMTSNRHFNITNWNLKSAPVTFKNGRNAVYSFQK